MGCLKMANEIRAYEVEMLFTASVGLKQINELLNQMGSRDELQIRDAVTISVKQTLPTVPSEDYLKLIAETIRKNYETKDINLTECHFTGYRYLREITLKEE